MSEAQVAERPAYQQRMIEEREQLADRLAKLTQFMGSEQHGALNYGDRHLLAEQHSHMGAYLRVLSERMARARVA